MSLECGECERDLRGGHDPSCSRHTPSPGSPEAVARGCTCPRIDNHHGRGAHGDGERNGWWMTAGCPLHGEEVPHG